VHYGISRIDWKLPASLRNGNRRPDQRPFELGNRSDQLEQKFAWLAARDLSAETVVRLDL